MKFVWSGPLIYFFKLISSFSLHFTRSGEDESSPAPGGFWSRPGGGGGGPGGGGGVGGVPPLHNTYHGHTPHHRTPLSLDFKPLRFTDSPPRSAAAAGGGEEEEVDVAERDRREASAAPSSSGDPLEVSLLVKLCFDTHPSLYAILTG